MTPEDYYREAASHALAGFQLLEEGLKSYIGCYYETVRQLLPETISYRYQKLDIQEAALGKLVSVFSKINSNDELVFELRKLVKTRDDLAHRAFVHLYGSLPPAKDLQSKASTFIDVAAQIGELLKSLNTETVKVVNERPTNGASAKET